MGALPDFPQRSETYERPRFSEMALEAAGPNTLRVPKEARTRISIIGPWTKPACGG
jgi:hypothetical protein